MIAVASQITGVSIVYLTICAEADERKHQSFASLAFVWEIHWGKLNSLHKGPVTRKMLPFDDVIMIFLQQGLKCYWERRRDDSLMLATIYDDTWNVLNMQHITPYSKRWDYSDISGGGT